MSNTQPETSTQGARAVSHAYPNLLTEQRPTVNTETAAELAPEI
jgi:hypothetical protein